MEKISPRIIFLVAVGAVVALAGIFSAHSASAATLSFSPSSGSYLSGRSFTVAIKVSSADQAMNAAQGEISFSTNDLEVLSISQTNSVLNLWVQNPTFSNQNGTVDFSGVAVNPGFQGNGGTVITITFEAKNSGAATLLFDSAAVLANDGKGTNILTGTSPANLTISPLSAQPVNTAPSSPASTPASAPSIAITSSPAISQGTWYALKQITFDWSVPANADGVDYTISNDPNLQLPNVSQGLISQTSYDLSTLSDGTWYFFVSFESGSSWSPPIRKSLMLDRTPPDPFVVTRTDTNEADAQPVFAWAATDQASGIDHYQVQIGDGNWFDPTSIENGSSSYVLPPQSPADMRTLTVRAFDKAGNYRDATAVFRVLHPGVPCTGNSFSCGVSGFLAQWGWLVVLIFILLVLGAYGFIYHLLHWKKRSQAQLEKFEEELHKDLAQIEKRGASLRKDSLEKAIEHIVDDVKGEIKKLEDK
jgi:hypothetical protein